MPFILPDLRPASAELFVLAMACLILFVDLFVKDTRRTAVFALTQLTLVGAAVVTWAGTSGEVVYTFSNMYVHDFLADMLKQLLYLTDIIVLFYARAYVVDRPLLGRGEFYTLTLFATLGMMVMISANHFITIFLGVELLSLSLYAMVALNRDSATAAEAAMKYLVLGALASGLMLYGMSMIYGAVGSLEIGEVAERLQAGVANHSILVLGLVFLVAGLAFKLGVVPFHMWIPDVYHGAPTAVGLFIGTAPKLAAFAIVLRILANGLLTLSYDWQMMLLIMAVLSIVLGNVAAIAQHNFKRMLAYSAIAHMGFMLLGLAVGVVGGDARFTLNAYSSALFYVVIYVLSSAGAFGMILLMARAGFEAEDLDDYKGLNRRNPWFAAMLMMLMLSMAGIPFFVGFFAKFAVLQAVVASGQIWLAVVAVIFSLIGAFYYLRVVKLMYFDAPADPTPIQAPLEVKALISANGLAVALLGLFPDTLMWFCLLAIRLSLSVFA
ncbi:NADH-quinone oxidoreductase subunit NuoN [Rhodocyclus gracilis]|uniref:NADH-quinone oxidoreductase subunit N n=1 Tax=Rhodocyclus tenuis TaxID=1066 RepID=A0A6L5JY80_RHOTE|nr:NADH-quinone oxidoreductase subunit NuoN [Rhodocyclus gracilis]MQY51148.1 NADH-quinone oxidoreductase subunit NuoN [Rhodocyclus gracilis]